MVRDYSKGFIYKLCCKDVNVKEIYVGSSINMKNRKNAHKSSSIVSNAKVYKYIRDNGGWSNWSMIWIKNFPCNSKKELVSEEDKIMRELNATLNTYNSIKSKEKLKANVERHKDYQKQWKKKWYENNKETFKQEQKKRYQNNKDNLSKKITCDCGCIISKSSLSRHTKSKKHLQLISS